MIGYFRVLVLLVTAATRSGCDDVDVAQPPGVTV